LIKAYPRFQPDVFDENLKLLREVEKLAAQKGCTTAQIALGWVVALSGRNGLPQILPIPGATTEERIVENMKPAKLSEEDMQAIDGILKSIPVVGDRYPAASMATLDR
jgi:pyridoxine 4-dehydrogenase